MPDAILTLNAGSSSLKFALFELEEAASLRLASHGEVEGIGTAPHFFALDARGKQIEERKWADAATPFADLVDAVLGWAEHHLGADTLRGVGHRVVHGGAAHHAPERVNDALLAALEKLVKLAPLHLPHNLDVIRAVRASRPALPQIACFDTAFHHTMPAIATRFALPRAYEKEGVRRYGFHGLSYEYIASRLRETAPALAAGKVIAAHLGSGASLCAMQNGRSIDTTMGFTALDGLVMGTRCGTLDPGVVLYLEQEHGLSPLQVQDLLYKESGLLGVSGGIASDMRDLLKSPAAEAADAVALFVYRIACEIGALTSVLGGLDGLVFTAGIGEHSPEIRARVCERLAWLGVRLDTAANARGARDIHSPDSRIAVLVIPTDEEAMIARHTRDVIGAGRSRSAVAKQVAAV